MSNLRRNDTAKREGALTDDDRRQLEKDVAIEEQRRLKKEMWRQELKSSRLFKIITWGKPFKDVAEGVIGFFVEWVGDILSLGLGAASIYFCAFKVRSIALTLIVSILFLLDFLLGLIPFAGDAVDFIFPSFYLSGRLIENYIDGKARWVDYLGWLLALVGFALLVLLGSWVFKTLSNADFSWMYSWL